LNFKAKKNSVSIETEFFMKGKTENSGGEKEPWGLEEKSSRDIEHNAYICVTR
jgi:hypothetical protein